MNLIRINYNGLGSLDTPGGTGEGLLSAPKVITQTDALGLLVLDSVLRSELGQVASPETFSVFHLNRDLKKKEAHSELMKK